MKFLNDIFLLPSLQQLLLSVCIWFLCFLLFQAEPRKSFDILALYKSDYYYYYYYKTAFWNKWNRFTQVVCYSRFPTISVKALKGRANREHQLLDVILSWYTTTASFMLPLQHQYPTDWNHSQQIKSLTLILCCFECRDPLLLLRAFTVYVRPILEYCSPVWNPVHIGDIKRIEAVQRRFTKRLSGYRHISCDTRLRLLGAESLELRRLKLDLIMMYKILHGLVAVSYTHLTLPTIYSV